MHVRVSLRGRLISSIVLLSEISEMLQTTKKYGMFCQDTFMSCKGVKLLDEFFVGLYFERGVKL